jgi:hypothetical protein
MGSDEEEPPDWRALVTKEQLMRIELELGQAQKQLESILPKWEPKQIVGKTQEEVESIFATWDPQQVAKTQFEVLTYNQVAVLIKILFVSREFMTGVIDHYDSGEPLIIATLARCTFELFLATRYAYSSQEKFREFFGRTLATIIKFNEKVLDAFTTHENRHMEQLLQLELVRLEQRKKSYSMMFGPIPSTPRPDLNFKDLATEFGLGEFYDFDYGILSLFVHPSLFYVAVAPEMTAILSEQEKPSTFHRDVVRAWSLDIAVDFSQRLLKFIESIRPTFLGR